MPYIIKRDMEGTFLRVSCQFSGFSDRSASGWQNDDDDEKSGKLVGNGGIICLCDDFLPIDKNNFVIPIRCV